MKKLVWTSLTFLAAACGDNNSGSGTDSGVDGPGADAPPVDVPIDTGSTFVPPMPYGPPISANGPDQIQAVKAVPGGNGWYLAGFAAQTPDGPKAIFVAKTTPTGPDITFGNIPNSGIALLAAVTPTGSGDEIDLAIQSDGKILVSFNAVNATDPTDRDVAVARLTTTGALDAAFGTAGIATIDFSTKGATTILDTARGLAVDANDNIFVHAVALGPVGTPATSDFALAKLGPDGDLSDGTNGTTGWGENDSGTRFINTEINGTSHNATPRGLVTLADGSVIAGGYVGNTGLVPGNVPLYYKVDANGDLVTTFGGAGTGIFFDAVLTRQTEIYNLALADGGTHVTTGGYGNVLGVDRDDWIAMKIDVTTGMRDLTWGGSTNGAVVIDVSPNMTSSNCRNAIALPGGKTLLVGSTRGAAANNTPAMDGVIAVLDADGTLDTDYGSGIHHFAFSSASDQNDAFWDAAVSGTKVLVGGWRGTSGAAQATTLNDDSYLIIFDLQP